MANNNNTPRVSIIITTFNGARYIAATIETVIRQSWQNWELIIVDDGSEDNTCEIISSIRDDRIQLHKAGRIGINGRIKNIGLKKATGELIAFIDHDDLWHPLKLEKQISALKEYAEAGFCLTGGYNFKTDPGQPVEYFYKKKTGIRFDNIFLSIFKSEIAVWTQSLLVKRDVLNASGPFDETSLFADPEFIYRLAYHYKAVVLYESLFFHRLHETNYTLLHWEKSHSDGLSVIRSYKNKKMLPADLAKDVLYRSHINFGEKCLRFKKKQKAVSSFLKAWKQKPLSIVPLKKIAKTIFY